jgi:Zn-dependent protease with chaperone function
MPRTAIAGLKSREYEHPFDRRALAALESNSALGLAFSKLNQYGVERIVRLQYAGSNLRVTKKNFTAAHDALAETCRLLDVAKPPELYVEWEEKPRAITVGDQRPMVVVSSGLLRTLSYDELLFAVGHEIGHLKSRHSLYNQMALLMPALGEVVKTATLGLGGLLSGGMQLSLANWQRMADFSSDRAGLLACQDLDAALGALVKLSAPPEPCADCLDLEGLVAQAREFSGYDFETLDKLVKVVSAVWQDQPWTVMRAAELIKWLDSGAYEALLRRTAPQSAQASAAPTAAAAAGAATVATAAPPPPPAGPALPVSGPLDPRS